MPERLGNKKLDEIHSCKFIPNPTSISHLHLICMASFKVCLILLIGNMKTMIGMIGQMKCNAKLRQNLLLERIETSSVDRIRGSRSVGVSSRSGNTSNRSGNMSGRRGNMSGQTRMWNRSESHRNGSFTSIVIHL